MGDQGQELNADREAGVGGVGSPWSVGRPGRSDKTKGTLSNRASEEVEWGQERTRTMGYGW